MINKSYSQANQDAFVLYCLKNKKQGIFLEIGSNDAIDINNTYLLEKEYDWKGFMIEYDQRYERSYKDHRKNSHYLIEDAVKIDYENLLKDCGDIDYLQIDLDVTNGSTIKCLQQLEKAMKKHKFSVVTFEHDIWQGDHFNTRKLSREIFKKHGYDLIFPDVKNDGYPYEDWYVHPANVTVSLKSNESLSHQEIIKLFV